MGIVYMIYVAFYMIVLGLNFLNKWYLENRPCI